jgi:hypothetical protein
MMDDSRALVMSREWPSTEEEEAQSEAESDTLPESVPGMSVESPFNGTPLPERGDILSCRYPYTEKYADIDSTDWSDPAAILPGTKSLRSPCLVLDTLVGRWQLAMGWAVPHVWVLYGTGAPAKAYPGKTTLTAAPGAPTGLHKETTFIFENHRILPYNPRFFVASKKSRSPRADSDEAAQAFRDDGAWYSDMMSPRAGSLAGW